MDGWIRNGTTPRSGGCKVAVLGPGSPTDHRLAVRMRGVISRDLVRSPAIPCYLPQLRAPLSVRYGRGARHWRGNRGSLRNLLLHIDEGLADGSSRDCNHLLRFTFAFFAVPLRRQTILVEQLRFPSGTATAKLIDTLHARHEGGGRWRVLGWSRRSRRPRWPAASRCPTLSRPGKQVLRRLVLPLAARVLCARLRQPAPL